MNSRCDVCDVEKQCGYPYKPCDCANYRKFRPIEQPPKPPKPQQTAKVIPLFKEQP